MMLTADLADLVDCLSTCFASLEENEVMGLSKNLIQVCLN